MDPAQCVKNSDGSDLVFVNILSLANMLKQDAPRLDGIGVFTPLFTCLLAKVHNVERLGELTHNLHL